MSLSVVGQKPPLSLCKDQSLSLPDMNEINLNSTPSCPAPDPSEPAIRTDMHGCPPDVPEEINVLGNASLHHGACLLAMREVLRALCVYAPGELKPGIAANVRAGTEAILARTDDKPLPDIFFHALLGEMNGYLDCLR
ncbi:hypothetical protein [Cupriavidus numazuensis]|nr:hypothetical protein [Cupriavidus numazuensis]